MKSIPFEWYEFPEGAKIAMSALATTGLMVIPGAQEDGSGVLFGGERYFSYAVGPFGFVVLGNKGTYRQKLSEDKLFPDTEQPVIVPFGEYLQVHG